MHGQAAAHGHHAPKSRKELAAVSLGALGVVYGDIGTSPLYAMKECLSSEHAVKVDPTSAAAVAEHYANVMGVVSLMFWALLLVVVIKYLVFVLRADNKGEGGILALAALVSRSTTGGSRAAKLSIAILLSLFGAGLLYGDGIITPAISVLGAIEGIGEKSASLQRFIVPLTVAILVTLFMFQRLGTHRIGAVFGWVMLVWFLVIGAYGVPYIAAHPQVLKAVNPVYAVNFFVHHGWHGFLLLGSVVLVVTGGEALYADMGHFGKTPIRVAWYAVVFPGLLLNYFGQGALYLSSPIGSISNPFYQLVPDALLIPTIVLATMAAIIASQALISGAFSLTNQAMQLGFIPRLTVVHTSRKNEGQIYIPEINYALMVACVLLVFAFKSSTNLAAAYGIAVTGTMAITSYLFFLVCRSRWNYSPAKALALLVPMISIDLAFFAANVEKVVAGGWFPLAVGVGVFIIMTTWWRGRLELSRVMDTGTIAADLFMADLAESGLPRVPGTAVFMASSKDGIPNVLLHHVKHNKVLHRQVVLLSVITENVPFVVGAKALEVRNLEHGFYRVVARTGFMQQPNVPRILARAGGQGLAWDESDTTYYLGRQTLLTSGKGAMARWRKVLFSFLSRNARPPTDFFQLPPNRVVELGLQIEV